MSQYSEIMAEMAAIREQNDWLVRAVKHLLGNEAGWQPEINLDEDDLELFEDGTVAAPDPNEHLAVRSPKVRGCAHVQTAIRDGHVTCTQCGGDLGCAHNQQGLVNGKVVCMRCQTVLGQSGIVGRDPNAPVPGQETHEASANNPGTPLVPYS